MAVYLICYLASYILARFGHYLISGLLLLAAAGWLYMEDYHWGKLANCHIIFS